MNGLNYDIFGISTRNLLQTDVYGLPECHWPCTKDATSVLSIMQYTVKNLKTEAETKNTTRFVLHCDNCSIQNKNRFTLWYLQYSICTSMIGKVRLIFLIAGHTKKLCDGIFGHIKRSFRREGALTPEDMYNLISRSSNESNFVTRSEDHGASGKLCSRIFYVHTNLKLSKYHVFKFCREYEGFVFAKDLSSTQN